MQISLVNDALSMLSDISTERASSLLSRVGTNALARQEQQTFAFWLSSEQTISSNATQAKTAQYPDTSTAEKTSEQDTSTRIREKENHVSDNEVESTAENSRDNYLLPCAVPERSPSTNLQKPEEPVSPPEEETSQHPVQNDSGTSDETKQAEILAATLPQSPGIDTRQPVSDSVLPGSAIADDSLNGTNTAKFFSSTIPINSATVDPDAEPNVAATEDSATELTATMTMESSPEEDNLVLAQMMDGTKKERATQEQTTYSLVLAANKTASETSVSKAANDEGVTDTKISEGLNLAGTQTASGKSLTEMAVALLPEQGRGGERAGPDDVTVTTENRSLGTSTPSAAIQSLTTSTKGILSIKAESILNRSGSSPIVDLAAETIRYMANNGEKSVTVRLSPSSLGDMRVEISTQNDVLTVKLVSANSTAREILNQHVNSLRDALSQSGLEVGQVTVTSGQASLNNSQLSQQQSGSWAQGNASAFSNGDYSLSSDLEEPPVSSLRRVANYNGTFDISV